MCACVSACLYVLQAVEDVPQPLHTKHKVGKGINRPGRLVQVYMEENSPLWERRQVGLASFVA